MKTLLFDAAGEPRLDVWLAGASGLTRSAVQKLIDSGRVLVNGAPAKARHKLQPGESVSYDVPAPRPSELKAEAIPLRILHQDDQLAVIEKPAGLVVHPAAGHADGTLVNALLHHLEDLSTGTGVGGELRPGIVHRIDRNTSGVLLVTKTDTAHLALARQFKEHSITRRYLGLCWGKLPELGEWNAPISRDPKERKRMAIVEGGRRAVTRFRALERFGTAATFFEAELLTGRTHQVRVHFAAHGFPLAGDAVYAAATRSARNRRDAGLEAFRRNCPAAVAPINALEERKRQFLHAAFLGFTHPSTGRRMEHSSDLPEDLAEVMVRLRVCPW
jgi:23S rRNA pseudouridine1911/1915/1917 synthase